MTASLAMLIFLSLALLFALLACSARNAERLLWGTVISSLGFGFAVLISGGNYYGLVMMAAFLVTDLVVYLYLRTQNLLPTRASKNPRSDRLYRVFYLWVAACSIAGLALVLWSSDLGLGGGGQGLRGIDLLHHRVWDSDWLIVLIPIVSLVGLVTGGFFLVRRER